MAVRARHWLSTASDTAERRRRQPAVAPLHNGPDAKGRAPRDARTLVGCALIAGSFGQPLLIRRFPIERSVGKQLAIGKRNGAELHRTITGVSPFVQVFPGVVDFDDAEARFIAVALLFSIFFIAVTIPARLV